MQNNSELEHLKFRPALRSFLRELLVFTLAMSLYSFSELIVSFVETSLQWRFTSDLRVTMLSVFRYLGLGLALWSVLVVCVIVLANRYKVNEYYVEAEWGIIARSTSVVELSAIRTVNVKQSLVQRILGVGTISFASAGTAGKDVIFKRILKPVGLQTYINQLRTTNVGLK